MDDRRFGFQPGLERRGGKCLVEIHLAFHAEQDAVEFAPDRRQRGEVVDLLRQSVAGECPLGLRLVLELVLGRRGIERQAVTLGEKLLAVVERRHRQVAQRAVEREHQRLRAGLFEIVGDRREQDIVERLAECLDLRVAPRDGLAVLPDLAIEVGGADRRLSLELDGRRGEQDPQPLVGQQVMQRHGAVAEVAQRSLQGAQAGKILFAELLLAVGRSTLSKLLLELGQEGIVCLTSQGQVGVELLLARLLGGGELLAVPDALEQRFALLRHCSELAADLLVALAPRAFLRGESRVVLARIGAALDEVDVLGVLEQRQHLLAFDQPALGEQ